MLFKINHTGSSEGDLDGQNCDPPNVRNMICRTPVQNYNIHLREYMYIAQFSTDTS